MKHTAAARWLQLDSARTGFIRRCEEYAFYTLPKLCTPNGYDQNSNALQHEWQSVGAQSVNHLSNKLMLAMFAPSRPFFRYQADDKLLAALAEADITEEQLGEMLAQGERKAVQKLDSMAARPKLYEAIKHLIVLGNVLLVMTKDGLRVMGIKNYCVKRDVEGKPLEVLIRECLRFDELALEVQQYMISIGQGKPDDSERKVELFKWIKRTANGDYVMTQHVDEIPLHPKFNGKWPAHKVPYRALTWDLADDSDYGTGLVEDYSGDFSALSTLSRAQVEAAILASEFRWLVNPGGMTRPDDLMNSENGAAVPGLEGDISLIANANGGAIALIQSVNADYIQRIGRGFLLTSAVTRQAERVTAEEIRIQATELETSLGGAYSRLAVDFQTPMAYWLTDMIKLSLEGSKIQPVVITGLDALSRNGDIDNLKMFLSDLAAVTTLPEALQSILKLRTIASKLAAGRGISTNDVLLSEEEVQANQAAQQQQMQEQQANQIGMEALGKAAVADATNGE